MKITHDSSSPDPEPTTHVMPTDMTGYMEGVHETVETLVRQISDLPPVEPDGTSKCPFAEELYDRKDQTQHELEAKLCQLRNYQTVISQDIAHNERNLLQILQDKDRLAHESVWMSYDDAQAMAEGNLFSLRALLTEITEAIAEVEKLLSESRGKVYPGKSSTSEGVVPSGEIITREDEEELGELLSLPPQREDEP